MNDIGLYNFSKKSFTKTDISEIKKSDLIIFSDGPKNNMDIPKVNNLRKYIKTITGFHSLTTYFKKSNIGLSQSITTGLNKIFKEYDRAII